MWMGVGVMVGKKGMEKIVEVEVKGEEKGKLGGRGGGVEKRNGGVKEVGGV